MASVSSAAIESIASLQTYRKSTLNTAVRESIYMEVAIQGRLCHPNILGLFAAFDDGGYICILSGLAEDSDLYRRLPDIRRDERVIVKHVVGPLLSAVATLHINGVMHRDLKVNTAVLESISIPFACSEQFTRMHAEVLFKTFQIL